MSALPTEPTPGQVLAAARQRQNLNLADVSRQLRISERQLKALERDAYEELPGAVFVRGFIRNYSRLLRIDPEPLLLAIEPPPPSVETPKPQLTPAPRARWIYGFGAAALVLALALYLAGGDEGEETAALPTLTAAPKPEVSPQVASLPVAEPSFGGATVQDDIKLVFKRESFVEIRDSTGKPLLNKSNPAGSTQTIVGRPPFSLVIGNAEHVEMTYQGETIDLAPHSKAGVARLILN